MLDNPMVTGQAFTQYDTSKEPKTIGHCSWCNEELVEGYEAKEYEGEYFCDELCFAKYMGLEDVGA